MRKILYISMWFTLVIGLGVLLGFVSKAEDQHPCTAVDVRVEQDGENFFVNAEDVKNTLLNNGDTLIGKPAAKISVYAIEHQLNSHSAISNAEVSLGINGALHINVKQRRPIARVFTASGESYYIDEEGLLMPLSDKFTSNVPVFTGLISEPYASMYKYNINDIIKSVELKNKTILDEIFVLAQFIVADPFWNAQIPQIAVVEGGEFTLIPRVGEHKILLGPIDDFEEKFNKLKTFYKEGLNYTGGWNAYSIINLKFKNQIVCTKKVKAESHEQN